MKWDAEGLSDISQSNGKPWEGVKKKIQFYGDVEGLLILSKVPECENWGDRYTSCGGPSGLVEGENDHCQVLG